MLQKTATAAKIEYDTCSVQHLEH